MGGSIESRFGTSVVPHRIGTLRAALGVAAIVACTSSATPAARSEFAPSRILHVDQSVDALAADGSRAAFLWDGFSVEVWDIRTGRRRQAGGCDSGVSDLAIARGVVGYLCFEDTLDIHRREVDTVPLVRGRGAFLDYR